jgi:hypothetical protein
MGLGKELTGSGGAIALTIASAKRLWLAAGQISQDGAPALPPRSRQTSIDGSMAWCQGRQEEHVNFAALEGRQW